MDLGCKKAVAGLEPGVVIASQHDLGLQVAYARYAGVEPELRRELEQRAAAIGPAVELNDLLACDRFDLMAEVGNIRIPTLVIGGADDEMTPVRYADYLAERIPGAQKAIIPGASHFVQLQQPQAVNAAIAGFLKSL